MPTTCAAANSAVCVMLTLQSVISQSRGLCNALQAGELNLGAPTDPVEFRSPARRSVQCRNQGLSLRLLLRQKSPRWIDLQRMLLRSFSVRIRRMNRSLMAGFKEEILWISTRSNPETRFIRGYSPVHQLRGRLLRWRIYWEEDIFGWRPGFVQE